MSSKSIMTSSLRSYTESLRTHDAHEKLHIGSGDERVMFASDESKDQLYESKRDKKMVRVVTVIIYVFCVSLAAIMLSLYYVFFWEPKGMQYSKQQVASRPNTEANTPPICTPGPHSEQLSSSPITESSEPPDESLSTLETVESSSISIPRSEASTPLRPTQSNHVFDGAPALPAKSLYLRKKRRRHNVK